MSDSWRARTGPLSILAGVLWLLWVGLGTLAVRLDSDPSVGLWDLLAVQRSESHALWRVARGHTVVGGGLFISGTGRPPNGSWIPDGTGRART